jgi:hypothetical protein
MKNIACLINRTMFLDIDDDDLQICFELSYFLGVKRFINVSAFFGANPPTSLLKKM